MILGYDTETTDLINDKAPPQHPSQPYLVQLAMILKEYDGTERARVALVIDPFQKGEAKELVTSGPYALAAHGITAEKAAECGVPLRVGVAVFTNLVRLATHRVAHNDDFDKVVMQAAMHRVGVSPEIIGMFLGLSTICTKNSSIHVVNLPPTAKMIKAGFGNKPKPPSVAECCKFFFDREPTKAHDALGDVSDCMDVYFELVRRGHLPDLAQRLAPAEATPAA